MDFHTYHLFFFLMLPFQSSIHRRKTGRHHKERDHKVSWAIHFFVRSSSPVLVHLKCSLTSYLCVDGNALLVVPEACLFGVYIPHSFYHLEFFSDSMLQYLRIIGTSSRRHTYLGYFILFA